jgi:hypothetical protein
MEEQKHKSATGTALKRTNDLYTSVAPCASPSWLPSHSSLGHEARAGVTGFIPDQYSGNEPITEFLKVLIYALMCHHAPPHIPSRSSIGTRGDWNYPGSTFCSKITSAVARYAARSGSAQEGVTEGKHSALFERVWYQVAQVGDRKTIDSVLIS